MAAYIDWSDPDGIFDMLVEYVGDEKNEAHGDSHRERFLGQLLAKLISAQGRTENLSEIRGQLKKIIESVNPDFRQDPVMDHLEACLEELERFKPE